MALYYIAQDYSKDHTELVTQLICKVNGAERIIEKRNPLIEAEQQPGPGQAKLIEIRSKQDGMAVIRTFLEIVRLGRFTGTNHKTGEAVTFDIETIEAIAEPGDGDAAAS